MESSSPQPQSPPAIDPYAPPKVDVHLADQADNALYSPRAIIACTVLLTPALGGIMAARNWRRLNDRKRATLTLATGIVATVVLVAAGMLLPDSMSSVLRGGSIGVTVALGMQWRRDLTARYEAHLKGGGQTASPLVPVLIALAVVALFVVAIIFTVNGPSPSPLQ